MTSMPGAVRPELTDDAFLGGALNILQPRSGYRAGLDAVILAAAVPVDATSTLRVLDVGAGVGTAGLCVARRVSSAEVVLLEKEPQLAALAVENAGRNALSERVRVATAEIASPAEMLRSLALGDESFDHVIANPPYHDVGAGTLAPDALKAAAHAMPEGELDRWARFMARMTAPGGTATMVHKADALTRLLTALSPRFGALKVMPLHPREGEAAHRVIVQGTKGSRAPLQVLPGFVLHGAGHEFTPAAQEILRHAAPFPLG